MKRFSAFAAFLILASCSGGSTVTSKSQPTAVAAGTTVGVAPATSTTSAKSSGKAALPKPDAKAACTTILAALAPILAKNSLPAATLESSGSPVTGATPRGVGCKAKGADGQVLVLSVGVATFGSEEFASESRARGAFNAGADSIVEVPRLGERAQFRGSDGMPYSSAELHVWSGSERYDIDLKLADNAPKPSQQYLVEMMTALQALDL
jgi:hypothetical protein